MDQLVAAGIDGIVDHPALDVIPAEILLVIPAVADADDLMLEQSDILQDVLLMVHLHESKLDLPAAIQTRAEISAKRIQIHVAPCALHGIVSLLHPLIEHGLIPVIVLIVDLLQQRAGRAVLAVQVHGEDDAARAGHEHEGAA